MIDTYIDCKRALYSIKRDLQKTTPSLIKRALRRGINIPPRYLHVKTHKLTNTTPIARRVERSKHARRLDVCSICSNISGAAHRLCQQPCNETRDTRPVALSVAKAQSQSALERQVQVGRRRVRAADSFPTCARVVFL